MENFGTYLKEQRERKGIRLEEIASITKIHLHNLELLETGRWEELPPEPFIRGFIIAYAKYVGLDSKDAIRKYTEELVEIENLRSPHPTSDTSSRLTPSEPAPTPASRPDQVMAQTRQFPIAKAGMIAGLALVVGVAFWLNRLGKESSAPVVAKKIAPLPESDPVVSTASPITTTTKEAAKPPTTAMTAPPAKQKEAVADLLAKAGMKTEETRKPAAVNPDGHELVVESKDRTWVKVVVDEEPPMELFLPAGEKATYQAKSKIKLVLGNSVGSKVIHNGVENSGKKFQGTIRSYIFPSNARFPQDKPRPTLSDPPAASETSPTTSATDTQ